MVEKDFRDLTVGEIHESMVGKPATVKEDAILKDAVDAITQDSTSHKVYIVDEEGKLKGAITIESLLKHVGYRVGVRETGMISFFKFLSGVLKENVAEIMEHPVTITNRHKVLDAVQLMVEHHLNDLPIIDDENILVGELNSLEIMVYAKSVFGK